MRVWWGSRCQALAGSEISVHPGDAPEAFAGITAAMTSTVQSLLIAGLRHQQSGDLRAALGAYEQVLRASPEHPDACQLIGMIARRQQDDASAERWFRRSLAAREAQPNVWNNLGNLLLASQRTTEALQAYERALQLDEGYAEAHYNRARALRNTSRLSEAAASLARAMALAKPPSTAMWQLKVQIESDAGNGAAAVRTLDAALEQSPGNAELWHNRGVLLQQAHQHAAALEAHDRALALGLDVADAHYNRGNTLQCLGLMEHAVAAYRTALQRQADHMLALGDLARLRWRLGDPDFDQELRRAMAQSPADARAAGILGWLLWRAERFEAAAAVFHEAARRAPDNPSWHDGLGSSLVRLGELTTGLEAHRRALALAPSDAEPICNYATSLLVCDRPVEALAAAESACVAAPNNQRALSLVGLARRLSTAQSVRPDDPPPVFVVPLAPPAGWQDMDAFNEALAAELRRLHGVERQAPVDQSLRGGTQTFGDIFSLGHPLIDALKQRISEAVTLTVTGMAGARDGSSDFASFFERRPSDPAAWRFKSAWSSRLVQGGFHTDHVHPHGWMSSAYYARVPDSVRDPDRREGWLRFGVPDFPLPGIDPESLVQKAVQPAPGLLVLFPSMLWHGTNPFQEAAERITIAFDVEPL